VKGFIKLLLTLLITLSIPYYIYAGSLPIQKVGKVSVRVIGSDTVNIINEILPSAPLFQEEQNSVSATAKKSHDTVKVTFNFYSQHSYKIGTTFVTEEGEKAGASIEKGSSDQSVSLNFANSESKKLSKVVYTLVSL
jgi:hypothetical protein